MYKADHYYHVYNRGCNREPIFANVVAHPGQWAYSNYLEWIEQRPGTLVDWGFVPNFFPHPRRLRNFCPV
jgi:hypothetical protein